MSEPGCIHHWRIDTPNGPTAAGVCRKCGRERMFATYSPEGLAAWEQMKRPSALCPDCGRTLGNPAGMATHRARKHGVEVAS